MISAEQEEEMVAFAGQIAQGLDKVSFEEQRRILELIQLRVDVIDQKHLKVSGLIMPPGPIVDTSRR